MQRPSETARNSGQYRGAHVWAQEAASEARDLVYSELPNRGVTPRSEHRTRVPQEVASCSLLASRRRVMTFNTASDPEPPFVHRCRRAAGSWLARDARAAA